MHAVLTDDLHPLLLCETEKLSFFSLQKLLEWKSLRLKAQFIESQIQLKTLQHQRRIT